MNIYVSHCGGNYDYENELYGPLRNSALARTNHLFLPHEPANIDVDAVSQMKHTNLLIAEASFPSTGQGIELAQAKAAGVPIVCFYKSGAKTSSSLRFVTNKVIEYSTIPDLLARLQLELDRLAESDSDSNVITLQSYQDKTKEYIDGTPEPDESVKIWIDEALSRIPKDGKILEIGSGFGRDAGYITSRGFELECSDAVPNFVTILQEKGLNARLLNVLTDELGVGYSMIFADGVLLHFSPEEFKAVIKKIHTALSSEGIFALSVKRGNGAVWTDEKLGAPRYFYYWQPEDLKDIMRECGFEWVDLMQSHTQHNKADWMRIICKKA